MQASHVACRACQIVRGLMSEDPQERLKWARAPLYQYKSSLSNTDFARLAGVQRQLSPYDGMPREGLGHPIGTLEDNAEAAAALSVGKFLRPFINLGRAGLERLGRQTDENNEVAPPSEAPGTTPSGTAAKIGKDGLTAAQRMAKNRADGLRFEQETGEELGAGQDEVFEQVTMRTKSGIKVRVDFATRNRETGEIRLFEAKASEKARLTRNQKAGYEEIEKSGGTVVGKGKPGFPGGTKIPPTKVEIIRPARKEP